MAELAYHISTGARKKRSLRIPQSHTLYLCPNSCARRQGIRAFKNGQADQVSFLCLSQSDVISGDYVVQTRDAVATLLNHLKSTPRVISLYVNCVDDFIGTDETALLSELSEEFSPIKFFFSRINPISADIREPVSRSLQTHLYEPLERADSRDGGITLVGNFEPLPASSEFHNIVEQLGCSTVRQLIDCTNFDEYLALARSSLVLSLSHLGDGVLLNMESKLGIPGQSWQAGYNPLAIEQAYQTLADKLGKEPIDCTFYKKQTRATIERTLAVLGDMPIAVDSSASMKPFSLTLDLLELGFNVVCVYALHNKGNDDEAEDRLRREFPSLSVVKNGSIEALLGSARSDNCLAIGVDSAFLLKTRFKVALYHDEGHFGFDGVSLLMQKMREALNKQEHSSHAFASLGCSTCAAHSGCDA